MKLRPALLTFLALAMFAAGLGRALAAAPVVSNVRSVQRAGTQLVDINYDLADADSSALTVSVVVSTNGGAGGGPCAGEQPENHLERRTGPSRQAVLQCAG